MATTDDLIRKSISQNITKYREKAGLTQKEFAIRLSVTPSRVSNWEQGTNCPTIDILFEVCKVLNVSINDIYGVYNNTNLKINYQERQLIEKYSHLDEYGKDMVNTILDKELERCTAAQKEKTNSSVRFINYYYCLASEETGQIHFDMPPTEKIEIPALWKYRRVDYAIGVNGDNMEPIYSDGDLLLVEMTNVVEIGEIGIFSVNGGCFIKRLENGELSSLNKEYENTPLKDSVKCIGKVIDKL